MNYTLAELRKIFIASYTGESISTLVIGNYFTIDQDIVFDEMIFDSSSFTQKRTINGLGTSFEKTLGLTFGNIVTDTSQYENKNLAILFEDNNGNNYLTGFEKPYSLAKRDLSIGDNTIDIEFNQISYEQIKPVSKFWFENANSVSFPRGGDFNVPSGLTGVTGGSILISWLNPNYNVPYKSFKVIRTNPQGHPSGLTTNISINNVSTTGYTDTSDYYYGGQYSYKVAIAEQLSGVNPYKFSNQISVETVNPNIPLNLTGSTTLNNVVLTWTNPVGGYKVPFQSFRIERTNPPLHPSGDTNVFYINSTGSTGYTDVNVGQTSVYAYKVAIAAGLSGNTPNQYSNIASIDVINYNIASGLTATTSGNSVVLNWSNPAGGYTYDVQSFAINRCQIVDGLKVNCVVLTFNDDGSATQYVDLNLGQSAGTGKTYSYQIATAKLPDGFDRQEFSTFSNDVFVQSVNEPPNVGFTGAYDISKYYGSWLVAPKLSVSGGTGIVTVYWKDTLSGSFLETQSQLINLSGGTTPFTVTLNSKSRDRGFGITRPWNLDVSGATGYNVVGNTPINLTLPKRLATPFGSSLSASQVGANVNLTWTQITNDTGATIQYGTAVGRYLTSDFGNTNTILAYVSGNSTTSYSDVSAPTGDYTYYILGVSLNGTVSSIYTSDASNFYPITIT